MAWVTAVAWVQFLGQELPHTMSSAKKKKKDKKKIQDFSVRGEADVNAKHKNENSIFSTIINELSNTTNL